jgi:ketosteroid isomerase-like protein
MTNVGLFDREVHATDDSELVFATFNSRAQLGGRPYVNRYICRARVRDGLATATSGMSPATVMGPV